MKKAILLGLLALSVSAGAYVVSSRIETEGRRCNPNGICKACKNCSACKHCHERGGKCSVCR
ncbi:hypothetical protein [Bergeyella cardium]|uniref:Uncharacterized protein n=1 Tax=Bergeyella cardium TaxID=1585976 RepID=A0A6P1QVN4_9FLAO|nr:hypothetical protein [Bergeyella cardium]QHN65825.1 hypothetical protein DBX24_08005 [Bergeyella cardium]WHE33424.1 hypothetical protein P8603_08055 [Bergeyella cardium]WHF60074.1 hypothetical protein O0R51_08050 [Bergeyella cardium]